MCSFRAEGLAARGIRTQRIDTYTTVPADWAPADLARAHAARLVTFGSPSAVRVWAERVGTAAAAVCIGETTAAEARNCGFADVVAPESPARNRIKSEGAGRGVGRLLRGGGGEGM